MSRPTVPRAPTADGAVVAVPALSEAGRLLDANRAQFIAARRRLFGRLLQEVREQARAEIIAAATRYLAARGQPLAGHRAYGIIATGHQPDLFHPGVWIKNFALAGLAKKHGLTTLNLIIDNDTVKSTGLRLPVPGDPPRLATVAFDSHVSESPYEEHRLADAAFFASFGERAAGVLRGWDFEPLLIDFWKSVCQGPRETWSLAERFPIARRALERRWGCHNLELPISALCGTKAFGDFTCHLLSNLPQFHALYNGVLQDYRRRHRIRGRNHPVPDLGTDGDWLEAPLWIWRAGKGRRGRVFARLQGDRIEVRGQRSQDNKQLSVVSCQLSVESEERRHASWSQLVSQGIKVRPRALSTTLFARVFVAELFIHGIGGAIYDEVTDELIQRFYELAPPGFLIVSGTRLLPMARSAATAEDCRRLALTLRDLYYNPDRHLAGEQNGAARAIAEQKKDWIARAVATSTEKRARFDAIRELSGQLRPYVKERQAAIADQLQRCRVELAANAVLGRRDFAFCLYPEESLRPFCQQLL